ncbi:MAG: hypothetical protein EZS28_041660, partial [Streblomastix strix]
MIHFFLRDDEEEGKAHEDGDTFVDEF